jgi:hypothetical protein
MRGWDVALALKPDRFNRIEKSQDQFIEDMRLEGREAWTVETGRLGEYRSAAERMSQKLVTQALPEMESRQISERTVPNMDEGKRANMHQGRPPVGLIWVRAEKLFRPSAWGEKIKADYEVAKASGLDDDDAMIEAGRRNPYPSGKVAGRTPTLSTVRRVIENLKGREPNEEKTQTGLWSKFLDQQKIDFGERDEHGSLVWTDEAWAEYRLKRARMKLPPPGIPCPEKCYDVLGGKRKRNPRTINVPSSFRTADERDRHVRREHPEEARADGR